MCEKSGLGEISLHSQVLYSSQWGRGRIKYGFDVLNSPII